MQDKFSRRNILLYLLGTIPVTWLALLIAPYLSRGLPGLLRNFGAIMEKPFHITFCEDSVRAVLIFLLVYGLGIGIYLSSERNYRRRQEHGSAKWGRAEAINKKYADKDWSKNKVLTRHVKKAEEEKRQPLLIRHFSVHNLRHTFCTRFCENETNLKVIQEIMGHADIETTMNIYAEATAQKKQESFTRLEGKIKIS